MKKKYCLLLLMLLACTSPIDAKNRFVRVFDLQGHKVAKGNLVATTDTSVVLESQKIMHEILVKDIGMIKTKRAIGHSIAIGAVIGALSGAVLGLLANDAAKDTYGSLVEDLDAGTTTAAGAVYGVAVGGAIGAIVDVAQKRMTILINGDAKEWQQKRKMLDFIVEDHPGK